VSFDHELAVATRLARQAGERIRALHRSGLAVDKKDDDSPVTEADRAADAIIRGGLTGEFPGDGLLSEETPDDGSRFRHERVWMIDPLDGTKDFVRGQSGFSVMIGLLLGDTPALGVVFQPIGDKLYQAARGQGAWLSVDGGAAVQLHVSAITDTTEIRMVASKSHRTKTIDQVREKLGINDELNIGSVGLKLGLIAEGERDLYVNPAGHSKLWDACAPEAILTEAGGKLTDAHGRPLRYRGQELGNRRGLIASNGHVHAAVVARLAELFPRGDLGDG
jgi:3'(2'), 5'-bisphosphate nucleotidase